VSAPRTSSRGAAALRFRPPSSYAEPRDISHLGSWLGFLLAITSVELVGRSGRASSSITRGARRSVRTDPRMAVEHQCKNGIEQPLIDQTMTRGVKCVEGD